MTAKSKGDGARESMTRIQLSEDIVWRDLDDEVIILDLASGTYFGLEGSGSHMWRLIAECGERRAVVQRLAAEFEATPARLEKDFDDLLRTLSEKKLITLSSEATAAKP